MRFHTTFLTWVLPGGYAILAPKVVFRFFSGNAPGQVVGWCLVEPDTLYQLELGPNFFN